VLLPVRFDIHWFPNQRHPSDWRDQRRGLPAFIRALASIHDSYGIILDASAVDPATGINYNETTDSEAWVSSAERNLLAFRALLASNPSLPGPSLMVIQSWDKSPATALPETNATGAPNPATLTGLLLYYLRSTQAVR
jgi:hypothetical protein